MQEVIANEVAESRDEPNELPPQAIDTTDAREGSPLADDISTVEVAEIHLATPYAFTGESLNIDILFENMSSSERSRTFAVKVDGELLTDLTISLGGHGRTTHALALRAGQLGEHTVTVAGKTERFTVLPASSKLQELVLTPEEVSITLIGIDRHDETATLWFWIEKRGTEWPNDLEYKVEVFDDHGNLYARTLRLDIGGSPGAVIDLLPSGFGYADTIDVAIPSIAPIGRIMLDSVAIENLPSDLDMLGSLPGVVEEMAAIGNEVRLGEWITYTLGDIEPAGGEWNLPLTVRNHDYVAIEAEINLGLQHEDGTISWTRKRAKVEGSSEITSRVALPTEMWINDSPAKPRCAIVCLSNAAAQESVVIIYPLRDTDLPPLVGQGATHVVEAFRRAYENGGGVDSLGAPSHLPSWFRGGTSPYDENDVLVQLYPNAPRWGGAALVLDEVDDAHSAILLPALYWEKYRGLGGPYFTSRSGIALGAPLSMEATSILFEGGSLQNTCTLRGQVSLKDCIHYLPPPLATLDFEVANESQLEISPDSRFISILEHSSGSANAYIVPIGNHNSAELLGEDMPRFRGVAFSPDGQLLAATHPSDNSISLWNIESRTLIRRMEGHRRLIGSEIAFSSDGSKLVTWCPDDIRIWNVQTGQLLHSFDDHNAWRTAHFFDSDGMAVFVVDGDKIELIDANSGRAIRSFEGHSDRIWELDLSRDGRILASGSSDGSVILWDVQSGQILMRLQANPDSLCFNPEGTILACSSGYWVDLWDTQQGQQLLSLHASDHWQGVEIVRISPDGKTLIAASWDDKVRLWDLSELMKGMQISENEEEASMQEDVISFDIAETLQIEMARTGEAVAVARGTPITREQLNARVDAAVAAKENSDYPADYNSSWKEVLAGSERSYYIRTIQQEELELLIVEALILDELQAAEKSVDFELVEAEAARQLAEFVEMQSMTEGQLDSWLQTQGKTSTQFMEDLRRIVWIEMAQQIIVGQPDLTDEELRKFYEVNRSDYFHEERVLASHILVDTKEEAEEVLAELSYGADFSELARDRSICPSSSSGGDLGWFGRGALAADFENAAFAATLGEVSGIVHTEFGYHIILVHKKVSASQPSYEDAREQIREDFTVDWVEREFELWLEDAMETDVTVYR